MRDLCCVLKPEPHFVTMDQRESDSMKICSHCREEICRACYRKFYGLKCWANHCRNCSKKCK